MTITAALFTLASIIGFSIGGLLSDHYGKRLTVFLSNLFAFVCWIISAIAKAKWLLFTSYTLQGLFSVIAYNCVGELNTCILRVKSIVSYPLFYL